MPQIQPQVIPQAPVAPDWDKSFLLNIFFLLFKSFFIFDKNFYPRSPEPVFIPEPEPVAAPRTTGFVPSDAQKSRAQKLAKFAVSSLGTG